MVELKCAITYNYDRPYNTTVLSCDGQAMDTRRPFNQYQSVEYAY